MNGVWFGQYHSEMDFGLILSSKTIGAPYPKMETVYVPGANGALDLTEYFGEVKYENRTLTFDFRTVFPACDFLNLFSDIQNEVHGHKMKIILDEDCDYYYIGRVNVNEWKSERRIGSVVIECDCEPYKFRTNETVVTRTIANNAIVHYQNSRLKLVPTIVTNANVTLENAGGTYTLDSAGTYQIPNVVFGYGQNTIKYTGNATVTLKYREGSL